jgi:uncharacterized protein YerC
MTLKETKELHRKIADYIRRHPEKTYETIHAELGLSIPMLSKIARQHGIFRKPQRASYISNDLLAKLEH